MRVDAAEIARSIEPGGVDDGDGKRFWVRRKTDPKRLRAKLKQVKDQLRWRRYQPLPEQGR